MLPQVPVNYKAVSNEWHNLQDQVLFFSEHTHSMLKHYIKNARIKQKI